MKIKVQYFDEERLKRDWNNYILDPIVITSTPSGDIKCRGYRCPLDNNWNYYFSEKEIETEKFEKFRIGENYFGFFTFVHTDNDYLYDDNHKLYLWEELKRGECILNEHRLKCNHKKVEWFTYVSKIINREKNLDKILNI